MIYTFDHTSETLLVIITYDIPNERGYLSSSIDRCVIEIQLYLRFLKSKTDFLHFYFLNMDISFDIQVTEMKSLTGVKTIHMEETVSPILDLGLSFDFIKKNG